MRQTSSGDPSQVGVEQLYSLPSRMPCLTEEHDALQVGKSFGRQVRGHPAAEGLAANEQTAVGTNPLPRLGNRLSKGRLEHRRLVRNAALLRHVREVEGDDVEATLREPPRDRHHERVALTGAGAVGEDEA